MSEAHSYSNNEEFLDEAFELITTRARRLALEREIRAANREDADTVYRLCVPGKTRTCDDDAVQRVGALKALEDRQRTGLQARRAAHCADEAARPLGIDLIGQDLCDEEQMVLLTALCGALSEERSTELFGDLAVGYYGNMSVEGIARLLDAQTTEQRLRVRKMLSADAPLVKRSLVFIDHLTNRPSWPDDLIGARLRITAEAFSVLVGDATALPAIPA